MITTLNVLDKDLIKNKILTPKELKDYSELRIGSNDGHEKWLFLHGIQSKITTAIEAGAVKEVPQTISDPKPSHAIRGAN